MNRSIVITTILAMIAFLGHSQNTSPNVIFILADDLGYGDLGCYGQKFIETPNLDHLADEGIKFLNHYAGSPVCAPSRASLLTGLHTGNSPIRGNRERFPQGQFPLPDSTSNIARTLKEHEYNTKLIGKWGLGYPNSTGNPLQQGFDSFYGYNCQRRAHHYFPRKLWKDDEVVRMSGKTYSHDQFTQQALEYIKEQRDSSFFLFLTYTIPHAKLEIPQANTRYYATKIEDDPAFDQFKKKDKTTIVKYASMVAKMDHDIGLILDQLDSMNLLENTIVFFSSDNGPHSENGYDPKLINSSGDLRGKKRELYEGGIRVPLIASWKGVINPGSTTDHVSAFWDFFPTITDMLNISDQDKTDGISYLPTLLDKASQVDHDFLYWEFHGKGGKQAVLQGDWKLIRTGVNSAHPKQELYDLSSDPFESNDLTGKQPVISNGLVKLMSSAHTKNPIFKFKFEK